MANPGLRIYALDLEIEGGAAGVAHVRTQIRGAVVALITGLPTTGANVFDSRPEGREWGKNDLPGLNVLTPSDVLNEDVPITKTAAGFDKETRQIQLVVECRAKGLDCAAVADQASAEVQGAIAVDEKLGGLSKGLSLTETGTSLSGEIDKPIAVCRLAFSVGYRIDATDPETPIK